MKLYGNDPEAEKRYSPATCLGVEVHAISGNPDPAAVSTSYVERQNLTAAVSLQFMHYKLARSHKTLANPYRRTPAVAAGVADHVWRIEEIVGLLNELGGVEPGSLGGEAVAHVGEDVTRLVADDGQDHDHHHRDEHQDQGVLDHTLPGFSVTIAATVTVSFDDGLRAEGASHASAPTGRGRGLHTSVLTPTFVWVEIAVTVW